MYIDRERERETDTCITSRCRYAVDSEADTQLQIYMSQSVNVFVRRQNRWVYLPCITNFTMHE